jgi:dihydroorotate dehydrogenase (fumarate)
MKDLSTTYLGIPVKNPIIIGSSGLSSTPESIEKLALHGAAAVVLKSVFEEEIIAEAEQTVRRQLGSDENNLEFFDYYDYQVKNDVLDAYVELIKKAKAKVNIPVIGSINCATAGEWVSYAKRIESAGADGIELNIFKLPFDIKGDGQQIEKLYFDICRTVKAHINIPVGIKLAPYFTNLGSVIHRLSNTGIEGLILFNRFMSMDMDIEKDAIVSGPIYSNTGDYQMPLRWMSVLSGKVGCDLVASTGVHDAHTVIKMLMAGAASVEVVSAVYLNGPDYISTLLEGVQQWMERRGFKSISAFKGRLAQKDNEHPEVFERVQFMKYFSDHS